MTEQPITTIEQRELTFYGDELTAVKTSDGQIYASLPQMCKALAIDTQSQRRRIGRSTVLSSGLRRVAILTTHRGRQETYALRQDLIPLWLAGLSTRSIKSDETRQKLEVYQMNAARVLLAAFQSGELSADNNFQELLAEGGEAVEAYKMLQGMLQLAKNQIILQAQVKDNTLRLDAIEAELGNAHRFVTVPQAEQLSQAVRAVGLLFSKATGRNEYGGVYGELYRRFGINSYKRLPATQFDEAMNWLRQWFEELNDGDDASF